MNGRPEGLRNSCYDPASRRFTLEDPIGIAGGSNAYGCASVTYSDPYGLKADSVRFPVIRSELEAPQNRKQNH